MASTKKEMIINVAYNILTTEGSSSFSMRKVAAGASMSLGNLQYYYKTKTDLINGILENYISMYKIELENYLKSSTMGRDGVEQLIQRVLEEIVRDDDNFFNTLFSFADLKGLEIPFKQYYKKIFDLLTNTLEIIIGVPAIPECYQSCTALLLPYFEGYGSVVYYAKIDHNKMAKVLTESVMGMIENETRK